MNKIKFAKPPLIEVSLGINLEGMELSSVHPGMYWQAIHERFPSIIDKEETDNSSMLPIRRTLFISSDETELVQIQDNFFAYNWRQGKGAYPHFEKIFSRFLEEWEYLQNWWLEYGDTNPKPISYEITYLNIIHRESGWLSAKDHEKFFSFVNKWNDLSEVPTVHFSRLLFSLPNNQGVLTADIQQRTLEQIDDEVEGDTDEVEGDTDNLANGLDCVFFGLIAKSRETTSELNEWFHLAHEFIVKVFLQLTTQEAQKKWEFYED